MNISINTPIEELLEMFVKYSHQIWKKISVTDETIITLNKIRNTLDKQGIPFVEIIAIEEESYILGYTHRGSRIERKVQILI